MSKEQVKKRIAGKVYILVMKARFGKVRRCFADLPSETQGVWKEEADQILSDPDILIKADDQSYPGMVFYCETCKRMVKNTKCNIVDSGWVKVEEK